MEISLAFQTDQPLSAYGPLAARAETYGFDACVFIKWDEIVGSKETAPAET